MGDLFHLGPEDLDCGTRSPVLVPFPTLDSCVTLGNLFK
jgi:hypothetical protein